MRIRYYSLMMALVAHPERTDLQLGWDGLKELYEEFLFGLTVLKRANPPPSMSWPRWNGEPGTK